MTYGKLRYEIVDDVAFIRLNDPDTLNAMSKQLGEELLDALGRAPGEARAILLGSIGRGFCSGANLTDGRVDLDDPGRDMGAMLEAVLNPVVQRMRDAEVPVITAVRGPAAGVGCGIALAGDLIIAGESACFYQAFGKVGLAPDGGSSWLLARAIGRPRAMEMMLLGEKLPAATALDWGLVNRVVPDEQVDATGLALARTLAQGPASLGIIKRVAWAALDATLDQALAHERAGQRDAGRTADFIEGVAAFRAKRPPVFRGR